MTVPHRPDIERILPVLVCPLTGQRLERNADSLVASPSGNRYPIVNGVPVFVRNAGRVEERTAADSNAMPPELEHRFETLDGWGLNIGAGGTKKHFSNCIELETAIWRHTDIVGDAHHLPFASNSFSLVAALNTFEHLADPARAAAEILRVLEPGGKLYLLTAFLQPLHEAPHHYYNCTEFGLRQWFQSFEITGCEVSGNFNPLAALAWITNEMLLDLRATLGPKKADLFASARCEDIRRFWSEPETQGGPLWEAFRSLPQERQKRYAAGFELRASKPLGNGNERDPDTEARATPGPRSPAEPTGDELMEVPARRLADTLYRKARRRLGRLLGRR